MNNFTAEFGFPAMSISAIKYGSYFIGSSSKLWMEKKATVFQMPQENVSSIITNARYSLFYQGHIFEIHCDLKFSKYLNYIW